MTLVSYQNLVNKVMLRLEFLKEMVQEVAKIRQNINPTHDTQKTYEYLKKKLRECRVRAHVYLRVKPWKSSFKLGGCAKLAPRYCKPFEVLDRVRHISYRIALHTNMKVPNVFHISLVKQYLHDPNHVIDWIGT